MPITVECTSCQRVVRVKDEFAGRKVRCPGCQATVPVPAASDDAEFGDKFEDTAEPASPPPIARSKQASGRSKRGGKSTSPWYRRHWHWLVALLVLLLALWPAGGLVIAMLASAVGVLMTLVGGIVPFLRVIFGDPGTVLSLILSRSARFEMMRQSENHPYKKLVRTAFDPTRGLFWRGVLLTVLFLPAAIINNGAKEWLRTRRNQAAAAQAPAQFPNVAPGGPIFAPNAAGGTQPVAGPEPGQAPPPFPNRPPGVPSAPGQTPDSPVGGQPLNPAFPDQGQPPATVDGGTYYLTVTYGDFTGTDSVAEAATKAISELPAFKPESLRVDEDAKTIRFEHQGEPAMQSLMMTFARNGFPRAKYRSSKTPPR